VDDDDENDANASQRRKEQRMSNVRAVQNMFYSPDAAAADSRSANNEASAESKSSSSSSTPRLDFDTGIFYNLPLWREKLGYTELPGRSLLGFVKDPAYTHMFETLLRSGSGGGDGSSNSNNRYFGQLRMDNDDVGINVNAAAPSPLLSAAAPPPPRPRETDMSTPLHGWNDRLTNDEAVVVGTLMRINDHVRLDDGRLMLHLHAVERFVVLEPSRLLPYPRADVMLLPDEEELVAAEGETKDGNNTATIGIGSAVEQSLLRWNRFEFDSSVRFPMARRGEGDDDAIMSLAEVLLSGGEDAFGSLIPFAPYAYSYSEGELDHNNNSKAEHRAEQTTTSGSTTPDISELAKHNVTREAKSFALEQLECTINQNTMQHTDEIERDLWILIDEYVQLRDVTDVFPKHLLSLLPKGMDWPEQFALNKLANAYAAIALAAKAEEGDNNSFAYVADRSDYPNQRRQKRLSYACTALLGGPVNDHPLLNRTMRRRLLEMPSTKGRLWAARELFEAYNSQFR